MQTIDGKKPLVIVASHGAAPNTYKTNATNWAKLKWPVLTFFPEKATGGDQAQFPVHGASFAYGVASVGEPLSAERLIAVIKHVLENPTKYAPSHVMLISQDTIVLPGKVPETVLAGNKVWSCFPSAEDTDETIPDPIPSGPVVVSLKTLKTLLPLLEKAVTKDGCSTWNNCIADAIVEGKISCGNLSKHSFLRDPIQPTDEKAALEAAREGVTFFKGVIAIKDMTRAEGFNDRVLVMLTREHEVKVEEERQAPLLAAAAAAISQQNAQIGQSGIFAQSNRGAPVPRTIYGNANAPQAKFAQVQRPQAANV